MATGTSFLIWVGCSRFRLRLFRSEEAATEFLKGLIEDLRSFEGKEIGEGLVLELFEEIEAPPIGTTPAAGKIVLNVTQSNQRVTFNIVLWVRGIVVAGAQMTAFDNVDRSADISLLARRMNLRITRTLRGEIKATPVVPPTPTPVPPTPEETALQAGFDLPAMALIAADLGTGAKVSSEGYSQQEGTIAGYGRDFGPAEGTVFEFRSSTILKLVTTLDLTATTDDARAQAVGVNALTPKFVGDLFGPALAEGAGQTAESITAESLDVSALGDAAAGFKLIIGTAIGPFEVHLLFFARDRVFVNMFAVGVGGRLAPDDVIGLAQTLSNRIGEKAPQ